MAAARVTIIDKMASTSADDRFHALAVSEAKNSGRAAYWGSQAENANKVWVVSLWNTVAESYKANVTASSGTESRLVYHVEFLQSSLQALESPLTDLVIGVSTGSAAETKLLEETMRSSFAKVQTINSPGGPNAVSIGWADQAAIAAFQEKRGFFVAVGWDSVNAKNAFQSANKSPGQRQEMTGSAGWHTGHVSFQKVVAQ